MNAGKLLGLVAAACLIAPAAFATEWNVIKQNGRDYVSFRNLAEFYHFGEFSHANRTISLRSERRGILAHAETNEIRINGVKFYTLYPLEMENGENLISAVDVGKIVEPVLRPSRLKNAQKVETVVIDPGHGGTDIGTKNSWGTEKAFALDVALIARDQLQRAGFTVEMTRSGDQGLSLEERVEFANRFSNAVFVSIHFNAGTGGAGVESYALAPEGVPSTQSGGHHASSADAQPDNGNAQDGHNVALTAAVHASLLSRVSAHDRGVRHARFKVLRHIKIPAVLVEGGFLNDPAEGQRIATPQYRQQLGTGIAQGVQNYNAAVNYRSGNAAFTVARANLPAHSRSITEPLHAAPPAAPIAPEQPSVSISAGEQ